MLESKQMPRSKVSHCNKKKKFNTYMALNTSRLKYWAITYKSLKYIAKLKLVKYCYKIF